LVRHSSGYQLNGSPLSNGIDMDSLSYTYNRINRSSGAVTTYDPSNQSYSYDRDNYIYTNQLNHVTDGHGNVYGYDNKIDLSSQSSDNYIYDEIGQLVKDDSSYIDSIYWTPSGKVQYIKFTSGSGTPDLQFTYDANGIRNRKIEYTTSTEINITY